jgi:hypothetical protein
VEVGDVVANNGKDGDGAGDGQGGDARDGTDVRGAGDGAAATKETARNETKDNHEPEV